MARTVGQVAGLAGVTVRTLHHYDEIGLLHPSTRSAAGYRLYDEADLERLFSILSYRELGFSLDAIASMLSDRSRPTTEHLREQRRLLIAELNRLRRMREAIDRSLEAETMGAALTPEEKFELFGDWAEHEQEYAAEAERRWGDTEAYAESQRRVSSYTKEDWRQIKAEKDALESRVAELVQAGAAVDSERAKALAEDHRQHIQRWFNDVPYAMHVGMGRMYVDDDRFRSYYEQIAPGAAEWMAQAIAANAADAAGQT